MTRAEQEREEALVRFMDKSNRFLSALFVRMCTDCNLRERVGEMKAELRAMSEAHVAVMQERATKEGE